MTEAGHFHDEYGNPVAANQTPPDVNALPPLDKSKLPGRLPKGIEARVLNGNWYGYGPEVIYWNPEFEVWTSTPLRHHCKIYHDKMVRCVLYGMKEKKNSKHARTNEEWQAIFDANPVR